VYVDILGRSEPGLVAQLVRALLVLEQFCCIFNKNINTMKIELQKPYSDVFKSGYLLTNSEPRRVVCLVGLDGKKTSVSYARYLLSCKIGKFIEPGFHVDHIDGNKLNDSISNLQILTKKDKYIKR